MIGDGETNFPHKLLLTNRQVVNLCNAFADKSPTDINLSKTQMSKMIKSRGFLGRLLGPLLKTGLPLIKNVIKPLAKSVLIPLGLTAASSTTDAGLHKKILGSGKCPLSSPLLTRPSSSASHNNAILIISNDEMKDIVKIVKTLEDSGLLPEGISEAIQNEAKEQRGGFLSKSLGTLGASLLGDILTGKEINKTEKGHGQGIVSAGYGSNYQSKKSFFLQFIHWWILK